MMSNCQVYNQDFFSAFSNINQYSVEENNQQKQIGYSVLMESGLVGGYIDGHYFLSPELVARRAKDFIGKPVDLNHDNNAIGVVLDVFFNDNGFTTESGNFVDKDFQWWAKFECDGNINLSNMGVSTQYTPTKEATTEYNDIKCDFIITDLIPRFLSVVEKRTARYDASQDIINSSIENNLDNKEKDNFSIVNTNPMPDDIKEEENPKSEITLSDVIQKLEVIENKIDSMTVTNSDKKEDTEEEKPSESMDKKENDVKNDDSKIDEVLSLLKELLQREKSEAIEDVKNNSLSVKKLLDNKQAARFIGDII